MRWKGFLFGGLLGSALGPVGSLLGAFLGDRVERELTKGSGSTARRAGQAWGRFASGRDRATVFCASAAAMFAKLAKADGRVTKSEIACVEGAFARLGFNSAARAYAVNVFRKAKDDRFTIYEYAQEFADAVESTAVCEFLYQLLWDLAAADGVVSAEERGILAKIVVPLRISPRWFYVFESDRAGGARRAPPPARDTLAEAYQLLDVSESAPDDEVKRAYREKAKQYHPDRLRAQGLPPEMVAKATDLMAKVNAAWDEIKSARGLS